MSLTMPESAPAPPVPTYTVKLTLPPSQKHPRRLELHLMRDMLFVEVWSSSSDNILADARALLSKCYLQVESPASLYIGGASFAVSDQEAQQLRAALEPQGLRIRNTTATQS